MRMLVVDAFTDRPFSGNPAGVCLLNEPADPAWMQRVAMEMKHSETAFVRPLGEGAASPGTGAPASGGTTPLTALEHFEIRWFTPLTEVALCGHATLASAHALFDTATVPADLPVRFRTLESGVLTVTRDAGGALEMDFPASPAEPTATPAGLAEALGADIVRIGRTSQNDLVVEVADEATVRGLDPDIRALGRIEARGVIVTAPATPGGEHDFVSRFFGARVLLGDGEDPVTGSAHCALAPYWAERFGRDVLLGYQASERGGHVRVALRGDRVLLSGTAVTVLDGTFTA